MNASVTLIDRATQAEKSNSQALSTALGMSESALAVSKHRGHISPEVAAKLADRLGLDPALWAGIAALEAIKQPDAKTKTLLQRLRERARNSWLAITGRPGAARPSQRAPRARHRTA